jgi:hypothetical protein
MCLANVISEVCAATDAPIAAAQHANAMRPRRAGAHGGKDLTPTVRRSGYDERHALSNSEIDVARHGAQKKEGEPELAPFFHHRPV